MLTLTTLSNTRSKDIPLIQFKGKMTPTFLPYDNGFQDTSVNSTHFPCSHNDFTIKRIYNIPAGWTPEVLAYLKQHTLISEKNVIEEALDTLSGNARKISGVQAECLKEYAEHENGYSPELANERRQYILSPQWVKDRATEMRKDFWLVANRKDDDCICGFLWVTDLEKARREEEKAQASKPAQGQLHYTSTIPPVGDIYIEGIYLSKDARRSGLAHRLLWETMHHYLDKSISLDVNTFNKPAIRFYQNLGFHQVGDIETAQVPRKNGKSETIYLMTMLLESDQHDVYKKALKICGEKLEEANRRLDTVA